MMASKLRSTINLRMMMLAAAAAMAAAGAVGCDKTDASNSAGSKTAELSDTTSAPTDPSSAPQPTIVYDDGPAPTDATVLASTGDIEVTLADFKRSMRQAKLVAPDKTSDISKTRLAMPSLQINVVNNLLTSKLITAEAKRRGLTVSADQKVAALKSVKTLAKYAPALAESGADAGLSDATVGPGVAIADLDAVATDLALRHELRAALIDDIDDDQMWRAYAKQHNRAKLLLASVRNTPSLDDISAYIDAHRDRIQTYFDAHKKTYRPPARVVLTKIGPAPGEQATRQDLAAAAGRLAAGDSAAAIGAALGLEVDEKVALVRGENPKAFGSKPGKTGFQMKGARGAYAWKVVGSRPSKPATLNGAVTREIAAKLLRTESIIGSKRDQVTQAIAMMRSAGESSDGPALGDDALADLVQTLDAKGLKTVQTDPFPYTERGYIPGVGLAKKVVDQAFSATDDQPVNASPILARDKVWAFRILARERPTRAAFDEDKAEFRNKYIASMRGRIIELFSRKYQASHQTTLDLGPLRVKYGVLQKPKSGRH